jgi:sec-independent protein translocase protein TatB
MLDIGWTELLVIAVVAIVFVGPKELPRLLRTVGGTVTKVRRMARDFQRQINDAVRDEELEKLQRDMAKTGRQLDSDIRRNLVVPGSASSAPRTSEIVAPEGSPPDAVMTPLPRSREEALAAHVAREQGTGGTVVPMNTKRAPVTAPEAEATAEEPSTPPAVAGGQP